MSLDKLENLYNRLISAGCNENSFTVPNVGQRSNDDVMALTLEDEDWVVGYWERGKRHKIDYRSENIDDAIKAFEKIVMSMEHRHTVAFTRSFQALIKTEAKLKKAKIQFQRTRHPKFNGQNDLVYRIFVRGGDIFKVENLFGTRDVISEAVKR